MTNLALLNHKKLTCQSTCLTDKGLLQNCRHKAHTIQIISYHKLTSMLSGTEQFPAVSLHEHRILALKKKMYDFPGSSTVFSNSVLIQVEHHDALCFLCSARQALPWAEMYSYLYSCCQYRRTESPERSSECFRHFAAAKIRACSFVYSCLTDTSRNSFSSQTCFFAHPCTATQVNTCPVMLSATHCIAGKPYSCEYFTKFGNKIVNRTAKFIIFLISVGKKMAELFAPFILVHKSGEEVMIKCILEH